MDKVNEESILLTKQNYFARNNKVKQWLEVSNELVEKHNNVETKFLLGDYYQKTKNFKDAIKYYSLIAKDDAKYHIPCLERMCECFYYLKDFKSFKEILDILQKEDPEANNLHNLKYLYLVAKEYDKAEALVIKVSNSKSKRRNEIIYTYACFLHKDKNYEKAAKYFLLLEKEATKPIFDILAKYYYEGLGGVKKNINKAISYSLYVDSSSSHFRLGMIFTTDKEVKHDYDIAIYHLFRATQLKNIQAPIVLALIYDDKNSKHYSSKRRDEWFEYFFKANKYNERVHEQITSLLDSFCEEKHKKFEDLMDKYWNRKAIQA